MNLNKPRSLSTKLNLFIIAVILLVSGGLVWISYHISSQRIINAFLQQADRAAAYAKAEISTIDVDYFWQYINTDEFRELRERAIAANDEEMISDWMSTKPSVFYSDKYRQLMQAEELPEEAVDVENNPELYTLYDDFILMKTQLERTAELFDISVAYIQNDIGDVSYNLVDPVENLFYIGSIEDPIEAFDKYGENANIPATIYSSSFGWLCTTTLALENEETGEVAGTVGVDIDMARVMHTRRLFLVNSAIYVVALTVIAIIFSMYLMRRIVVNPLRQLSKGAANFADDTDGLTMEDVIRLPINSKDEIEDLYRQIRSMQERIVSYTDHLTKITADRERVNTELNMARRIQRDMIPAIFPAFPDHSEFDLFAMMDPAREVGGDFYDFFLLDESHLAVLIADVSDKGVPAALFMMSSMILIRYRSGKGGSPAEILGEVNKLICSSSKSKMFVTVWMGILDLETGIMTCANAGHEYPFVRGADGIFHMLKDKHGLVVGGLPTSVYRDYELKLEPGDAVFVYTDGIPEANDPDTQLFGMDRLEKTLNRMPEASPREILDNVRADVDEFVRGANQFDDLTMLCLEYKGPAESKSADDPA